MTSADSPSEVPAGAAPAADDDEFPIGESRWPPALALVAFLIVNVVVRLWLPGEAAIRLPWLLPGIEVLLLVVLIAGPGRVGSRAPTLRRVSLALVGVLV